MYNKVILAATAAILFTGSAMAADAIVYSAPAPAPVAPIKTFSWEGPYAGVNLGYGFGNIKNNNNGVTTKPRGFLGGIQAGYNWQFDNMVAGIEADFQGSGMKNSKDYSIEKELGSWPVTYKYSLANTDTAKVQYFGTVRGRLGTVIGERTLLYGTAGLAYGKVKVDAVNAEQSFSGSKTRAGYTVGAGVEYAFTDKITLKTEYLYTDLGKVKFEDKALTTSDVKANFHAVRVGVNYKF